MAKKFGKFLLLTAAIGTAIGAYMYVQTKKCSVEEEDDDCDDFDDFSDDSASYSFDDSSERSYTPLEFESATNSDSTAEPVKDPVKDSSKDSVEVEEFFDDEDPSMDAM